MSNVMWVSTVRSGQFQLPTFSFRSFVTVDRDSAVITLLNQPWAYKSIVLIE